jgi:copper chaperone CopZ
MRLSFMPKDIGGDQLAIIKIEGMHCHKCEAGVRKALSAIPGVHEVEVDFNSKQASILFERDKVELAALMNAINSAGYKAQGLMTNTPADASLAAPRVGRSA